MSNWRHTRRGEGADAFLLLDCEREASPLEYQWFALAILEIEHLAGEDHVAAIC